PAEAEEQAIGAGHVGGGVRGEGWILACLDSKNDIDRVLGEDGEQGDGGQRQGAWNIVFGGFGAPRHGEGRTDDGQAVKKRGDLHRDAGRAEVAKGSW